MKRFEKFMHIANVTFETQACATGTKAEVQAAIKDGLLPKSALQATSGVTRKRRERSLLIGQAIGHLRLMKEIVDRGLPSANILQDNEVVYGEFRERRNALLGQLPVKLD